MAYTRSGLIWQQRTQEALRFVFKAARFGVITRKTLHAQSYSYHNAYTLLLSQALNTSSVDYETSKKKKENPTESVEGQGVAIYRQVNNNATTAAFSSYYSQLAGVSKLDKTVHRRQPDFIFWARTKNNS